jgi:ParB family chromosome partitioning protein
MESVLSVSPFRCRMWSFHERLEEQVNESSCREIIESIKTHGQRIPALGRLVKPECGVDIELIYGARRLLAARLLGRPLLVQLRELVDRDAIIAMDVENRQRKDISPYERAQSYVSYLHSGLFSTQNDIALALKVSTSQVSRLLKLARLPCVIVSAFGNPLLICEMWGLELVNAIENPQRRNLIVDRARAIISCGERLPARLVYKKLIKASNGPRNSRPVHDKVVAGPDGNSLFRIRHLQNAIALVLPLGAVSAHSMSQICAALSEILQPARSRGETSGVLTRGSAIRANRAHAGVERVL